MLVVRKPSRETDLGRKSFVPCDRRGSGLRISEIRRRAENPLAAKKQCVRYSHPSVSQNQTKADGAKTPVCISNRKKSKCHLSRCVTNSYVDMRMRQPDSSGGEYTTLAEAKAAGAPTLNYGLFFNVLLDFLIVAFAVFMLVRQVNRLKRVENYRKRPERPAPSVTPTLLPRRLVTPSAHLL